MRPVNLIPEDQRRKAGGVGASPLAFIVVGALFLLLAGVVMTVLTSNEISDRKAEVSELKVRKAEVAARADRLAPYADFQKAEEQRTQAVFTLADTRFDWVRVIRQLSLILPPHVWLTNLTGSAGAGLGGAEGAGAEVSSSIAGPSLQLSGCARGQDTVAAFVASLKEIDGVTRVGLANSSLGGSSSAGGSSGGCSGSGIASFQLSVAFDEAPASLNAGGAEQVDATATAEAPETAASPSPTATPAG